MSIVECSECGGAVSTKAKACPHCSAEVSGDGGGCGCAFLLLVAVLIVAAFVTIGGDAQDNSPRTPEEVRKSRIMRHFSSWDGGHRGAVKVIKAALHNPASYEHVSTRYKDDGHSDDYAIKVIYRAENAFGGTITNWMIARVSVASGDVLDVVAEGVGEGPAF